MCSCVGIGTRSNKIKVPGSLASGAKQQRIHVFSFGTERHSKQAIPDAIRRQPVRNIAGQSDSNFQPRV
jgi:hypothetical protein